MNNIEVIDRNWRSGIFARAGHPVVLVVLALVMTLLCLTESLHAAPQSSGIFGPRIRVNYLSKGPVPLKYRKAPEPEEKQEDEDDTDPENKKSPDSGDDETDPDSGKDKDPSDSEDDGDEKESTEGDDSEKMSVNGGSFVADPDLPDNYTVEEDPILKSLRKYKNSSLTSIWDAPKVRVPGSGMEEKMVQTAIPRSNMTDLLQGTYFGQRTEENHEVPEWQQFGDQIIDELQNLSENLKNGEAPPLLIRESPYPFGFQPPGQTWIPANSSVTYTSE